VVILCRIGYYASKKESIMPNCYHCIHFNILNIVTIYHWSVCLFSVIDLLVNLSDMETTVFFKYDHNTKRLEAYEDVSKSFRNGRLERELQMVQLSTTR
jgi:hypothetical protein